MKPIQMAVMFIVLTSAVELGRVEAGAADAPPVAPTQLQLISLPTPANLLEEGLKKQEQENYPGAIADYTEFLKTHPGRADAYSSRGFSKAMIEDLQGAIQDFDRAIELAPDIADTYNARGNVKAMAGKLAQSIRDFNRAIRCDRNFADAYYNRAIGRHDLGDRQGARLDFHQAAKLFRQQEDLGGYQQAREWIDKLR